MTRLRRRRGVLGTEDLRLWIEVARTAKPLPGKAVPLLKEPGPAEPPADPAPGSTQERGEARLERPGWPRAHHHPASGGPPLATLERSFVRRLRRGAAAPGAVIDLHGLRQEEAKVRLSAFLRRCQAEGTKAAIVITGKGRSGHSQDRGVLRRSVPLWLAMPELRGLVVGFEEAGGGLGGTGALIVRVRSARRHPAG